MSASADFDRLECQGLWRRDHDSQRLDVVVVMGESSLILRDTADRPLTHWALDAVDRIGESSAGAIYSPDPDCAETLEISDPLMIETIDQRGREAARAQPHPGQLRLAIAGAIFLAIGALGWFWLPGVLVDQAQSAMPPAARRDLDRGLIAQIEELTGPTCHSARGDRALTHLQQRLKLPAQVHVVPGELAAPLALPGGDLVLDQARLENAGDPALAAGWLAEAQAKHPQQLSEMLSALGPWPTLHLLTRGALREKDLERSARRWVTQGQASPAPEQIAALISDAAFPAEPWAAQSEHGAVTLALLKQSPATVPSEVLSDADWLALQSICGF